MPPLLDDSDDIKYVQNADACACVCMRGIRVNAGLGASTSCKLAILYGTLELSTDARVQAQWSLPCVWGLHKLGVLFQILLADELVLWR